MQDNTQWEESFDKDFPLKHEKEDGWLVRETEQDIKFFIQSLLLSERKRLVEIVEGMIKPNCEKGHISTVDFCGSCYDRFAWNEPLEDLLSTIKEDE